MAVIKFSFVTVFSFDVLAFNLFKLFYHLYQEFNFDSTKFKLKYVLGSGSFGVVTYAEYTDVNTKKITYYALKSLSKATVIETGT